MTIYSEKGHPCTVENPWPEQPVCVTRDGKVGETVSGQRFTVLTAPDETLILVPGP